MISIIIPSYNCSSTLKRTVESIFQQAFSDYEIIIVNDGSNDNTLEVAEEIKKRAPYKVKVLSFENKGAYNARLNGVEQSEAEWVMFVDSDDTLPETALKELTAEINKFSDIIVGTININNNYIFDNLVSGNLSPKEYIAALLDRRTSIGPVAKLFRRSLFDIPRLRIDGLIKQNEDLLMLIKLASQARNILVKKDIVAYNYLYRPLSASSEKRPLTEWRFLFAELDKTIHDLSYEEDIKVHLLEYKIKRLYLHGIKKNNDFSPIKETIIQLKSQANDINISVTAKHQLAIIANPIKRKVYCGFYQLKKVAKKMIGRS